MIEQVDRAVERFIRTRTPLPEETAALSFDTPDAEWSAARTRPTLSVFLWRINRSPVAPRAGIEQRLDEDGSRQRRPKTPVVDLHYIITAWAMEPFDEHQLLGSLLACVLAYPNLPEDVLPAPLASKRLGLSLSPHDFVVPGEIWQALGGAPRPAVLVQVALPFEVFAWHDVAREAERVEMPVRPMSRVTEPTKREERPVGVVRKRANGAMVLEGHQEPTAPVDS